MNFFLVHKQVALTLNPKETFLQNYCGFRFGSLRTFRQHFVRVSRNSNPYLSSSTLVISSDSIKKYNCNKNKLQNFVDNPQYFLIDSCLRTYRVCGEKKEYNNCSSNNNNNKIAYKISFLGNNKRVFNPNSYKTRLLQTICRHICGFTVYIGVTGSVWQDGAGEVELFQFVVDVCLHQIKLNQGGIETS